MANSHWQSFIMCYGPVSLIPIAYVIESAEVIHLENLMWL